MEMKRRIHQLCVWPCAARFHSHCKVPNGTRDVLAAVSRYGMGDRLGAAFGGAEESLWTVFRIAISGDLHVLCTRRSLNNRGEKKKIVAGTMVGYFRTNVEMGTLKDMFHPFITII